MEMLNSANMLLSFDLWAWILDGFSKWIVNYGWMIIVFTIVLKLVMTPLDVYQRVFSKKQARVNGLMQPEMQEIQKKYANDRNKLNQEQAKLYKKYNVSVGGMCLSMLLTMGISLVIFFTLFSSLRKVGNKKLYESYKSLDNVCVTQLAGRDIETLTDEEINEIQVEIKKEYKEVEKRNSWLWVKNVWKEDTKTTQFMSFKSYANKEKLNGEDKEKEKQDAFLRYELITTTIDGKKADNNGYYVLIILAVLVSFASQLLSSKLLTPKGQKLNTMNKVMMAIIPLSMLAFVFSSNTVFTLYIITNSVMTSIISTIITLIMKKTDKGLTDEQIVFKNKNVEVVEYSRNYKK